MDIGTALRAVERKGLLEVARGRDENSTEGAIDPAAWRCSQSGYYSVVSRAVAALEINTFKNRRAIYDCARALQERQLGNRPLNKAHYDRERSMLEHAISRVEAEATNGRIITYASAREPVQPKRYRPSFVSDLDDGPVVGTGLSRLIAAFAGLLGWRSKRKAQAVV